MRYDNQAITFYQVQAWQMMKGEYDDLRVRQLQTSKTSEAGVRHILNDGRR